MLVEELKVRGVTELPQSDLDDVVVQIIDAQTAQGRLRLVRRMWRNARDIREILDNADGPDWLRAPPGIDCYETAESARVTLDASAVPFLERAFATLFELDPNDDCEVAVTVWLDLQHTFDAEGRLVLHLGDETIGRVHPGLSPGLARVVRKESRRGAVLRLDGFLDRSNNLALFVNVPED
jgi:hypothetical protein